MVDFCLYSTNTIGFQIDRNGNGIAVSLTVRAVHQATYEIDTLRIFMNESQMRDLRDVLDSGLVAAPEKNDLVRAEVISSMILEQTMKLIGPS